MAPAVTGCQEANNKQQLPSLALALLKVLKIMQKAKPSDNACQSLIMQAGSLIITLYLPHPLRKIPL